MQRKLVSVAIVAVLALAAPAGAQPFLGDCMVGPSFGSTLLIPYFEVDLANPLGPTTLFSVNNGLANETMVRVVLWTDWGVPTLAFDVYLDGFDVQPINVRTLFSGNVPSTGEGVDLSAYPFCGGLPPFHANPRLSVNARTQLAADHTGRPGPIFADCAGEPHLDSIARGYVTVDVVDECSGVEDADTGGPAFTPADPLDYPYFADGGGETGIAVIDNRLWGDVIYVDFDNNAAQGAEAVAIWADADLFSGSGLFTFYGRFSGWDGRDDRVPLADLWDQRFLNGGAFSGGANLIVWRDTFAGGETPECGTTPSWRPLADFTGVLDEEADNFFQIGPDPTFPLATQKVDVASLAIPYDFGWIQIDTLGMAAWVEPTLTAGGRFSAAFNGTAVRSMCDRTPPAPLVTAQKARRRSTVGDKTERPRPSRKLRSEDRR